MTDRHKTKPKAVRMPDGLQARIEAVRADGETVNGFIVAAIEKEVERRSGGSTAPVAPPKRTRKPRTPAPAVFVAAEQPRTTAEHALNCKCGICKPPKENKR